MTKKMAPVLRRLYDQIPQAQVGDLDGKQLEQTVPTVGPGLMARLVRLLKSFFLLRSVR